MLLAVLLLGPLSLTTCARRSAPRPEPLDLLVDSNGDLLEFKPKELACPADARVRVRFRNIGKYVSFEHNWVLIRPHTYDAVLKAALEAGEGNHWLPHSDPDILAATRMCGKGQSAVIEFIAPSAGDYLFVCTSPGHAQSMWGILHVKAAWVKNALSILAYVQDDMARKLPGKAYSRLPHENQEFQEAAVPMREAALNEPVALRTKVDTLLTKAQAAARNAAEVSQTNDDAKIKAAVQAVADALKPLDELFPEGLRPVPGHLVGPGQRSGPPPDLK